MLAYLYTNQRQCELIFTSPSEVMGKFVCIVRDDVCEPCLPFNFLSVMSIDFVSINHAITDKLNRFLKDML